MCRMAAAARRFDGTNGEVDDWVRLVSTLLGTERRGVVLCASLPAVLVSGVCRASAVTLGSLVFFSRSGWTQIAAASDQGLVLVAHELAHVRQYRERGLVRFLWAYAREYFSGRLRGLSHRTAYREISFEIEARDVERVARRLLEMGVLLRGNWPPRAPDEGGVSRKCADQSASAPR